MMNLNKSSFSFSRYGVTLVPLREHQIDMVRRWRNAPRIRELMLTRSVISRQQQCEWFARMQRDPGQWYFLVYFKGEPIGVASLTAIDPIAGECEPGMYIYNTRYQGNIVPFSVAFALNDIAFEVFGLQRLRGKIFESNQASMRFHLACGYVLHTPKPGEQELDSLMPLSLVPDDYQRARQKLMRFMRF